MVCLWSLSHIYVNVLLNLSLMYVLCREHTHQIYALFWTVFGWRVFNIIHNSLISKNFQSPAGPYSIPLKPQFTSMGGKNLPFIPPCRWYRCDPQARVLYQRPGSLGLCAVLCLFLWTDTSDVIPGVFWSHSSNFRVTAPTAANYHWDHFKL